MVSVTGTALILFLTFHVAVNLVAITSAGGHSLVYELLGADWYASVAMLGLAAFFVIHIIYTFWLTTQNHTAYGSKCYAVVDRPKTVEWASWNMLVLGIIAILGSSLHLFNFWARMQLSGLIHNMGRVAGTAYAADGVYHIMNTSSNSAYVALCLVWLGTLWFHLTHGFWSSVQSLGWNSRAWINRWKCISNIYLAIAVVRFALVIAVLFIKLLACGAC